MKTVRLSLVCTLLLGFTLICNAQSIRIGIGGGYANLNGSSGITKSISEDGAGLKNGFVLGAKAKLDFPLIPLRLTGQAYYMRMNNSGNVSNNPPVKLETSINIVSVGVGGEYKFIPGPVAPYVALDLLYNAFGKVDMKFSPSSAGYTTTGNSSENRMGLGLGAGSEFTLLPKVDLDLNVKYNLMNLVGKKDGEESLNTVTVTANILFGL